MARYHHDLNHSGTIAGIIIDTAARGDDLYPFNQGRNILIEDPEVELKKITILEGKMTVHRQVKWHTGEHYFTKSFHDSATYAVSDDNTYIEYLPLTENNYEALRELFGCYTHMESSLPLIVFFADVLKNLFSIERPSNFITWVHHTKTFVFKTRGFSGNVPIADVDCTNMWSLAEFFRSSMLKHVSKEALTARLKEFYPL